MRNLTILLALTFTVMFSSASFADWKKVSSNLQGWNFYLDFERINRQGGYLYVWYLTDYKKPIAAGYLSSKVYRQVDCQMFRIKGLMWFFYNAPMGVGNHVLFNNKPDKDWIYSPPGSASEEILKSVCAYAK
jgi:hypothetical protein